MTKLRPPVSIEQALYKVLGVLGPELASKVTGRGAGYLTSMSDTDTRFQLAVKDAIALDLAYAELREQGTSAVYPIYEAYGLILETEASERFATAEALQRHAAEVAKEGGEAAEWVIRASLPNASSADKDRARRELEESIAADQAALRLLKDGPQGGPAP